MKLLLLGSGAFGLPTFQHLAQVHEVAGVVSQPDRPAGRKRQLTPTPVAQWALAAGFTLHREDDVNLPGFVDRIHELKVDAAVVIAFGQKLSPELVQAMGPLAVNLHASLLPRYRGAAPINWAMIRGETITGNSVIALAQRMDAGLIYAQNQTPIDPLETAGELHDRLARLGVPLMAQVLEDHVAGRAQPWAQDETLATKAPKLTKVDGVVDWAQSAEAVRCRVHGLNPWPGVRAVWRDQQGEDRLMLVHRVQVVADDQPAAAAGHAPGTLGADGTVACAQGCIQLLEVQMPGGKSMPREAFLRGHQLHTGDQLLPPPTAT